MSTTKVKKHFLSTNSSLRYVRTCKLCKKLTDTPKNITNYVCIPNSNSYTQILELFKYLQINADDESYDFCVVCIKELTNSYIFKRKCETIFPERESVQILKKPKKRGRKPKKSLISNKETTAEQISKKLCPDVSILNENSSLANTPDHTNIIQPITLQDVDRSTLNKSLENFEKVLDLLEDTSTQDLITAPFLNESRDQNIYDQNENKNKYIPNILSKKNPKNINDTKILHYQRENYEIYPKILVETNKNEIVKNSQKNQKFTSSASDLDRNEQRKSDENFNPNLSISNKIPTQRQCINDYNFISPDRNKNLSGNPLKVNKTLEKTQDANLFNSKCCGKKRDDFNDEFKNFAEFKYKQDSIFFKKGNVPKTSTSLLKGNYDANLRPNSKKIQSVPNLLNYIKFDKDFYNETKSSTFVPKSDSKKSQSLISTSFDKSDDFNNEMEAINKSKENIGCKLEAIVPKDHVSNFLPFSTETVTDFDSLNFIDTSSNRSESTITASFESESSVKFSSIVDYLRSDESKFDIKIKNPEIKSDIFDGHEMEKFPKMEFEYSDNSLNDVLFPETNLKLDENLFHDLIQDIQGDNFVNESRENTSNGKKFYESNSELLENTTNCKGNETKEHFGFESKNFGDNDIKLFETCFSNVIQNENENPELLKSKLKSSGKKTEKFLESTKIDKNDLKVDKTCFSNIINNETGKFFKDNSESLNSNGKKTENPFESTNFDSNDLKVVETCFSDVIKNENENFIELRENTLNGNGNRKKTKNLFESRKIEENDLALLKTCSPNDIKFGNKKFLNANLNLESQANNTLNGSGNRYITEQHLEKNITNIDDNDLKIAETCFPFSDVIKNEESGKFVTHSFISQENISNGKSNGNCKKTKKLFESMKIDGNDVMKLGKTCFSDVIKNENEIFLNNSEPQEYGSNENDNNTKKFHESTKIDENDLELVETSFSDVVKNENQEFLNGNSKLQENSLNSNGCNDTKKFLISTKIKENNLGLIETCISNTNKIVFETEKYLKGSKYEENIHGGNGNGKSYSYENKNLIVTNTKNNVRNNRKRVKTCCSDIKSKTQKKNGKFLILKRDYKFQENIPDGNSYDNENRRVSNTKNDENNDELVKTCSSNVIKDEIKSPSKNSELIDTYNGILDNRTENSKIILKSRQKRVENLSKLVASENNNNVDFKFVEKCSDFSNYGKSNGNCDEDKNVAIFEKLHQFFDDLNKSDMENKIQTKDVTKCYICKILFPNPTDDFKEHILTHKEHIFKCNTCSAKFTNKFFAKKHKCDDNNSDFCCLNCNYEFYDKDNLLHKCLPKKVKCTAKKHKASIDAQSLSKETVLKKKRTRSFSSVVKSDEKVFRTVTRSCSKRIRIPKIMPILHEKEHFNCHICNRNFWYRIRLERHMETVHGIKSVRYLCHICSESFMLRDQFVSHMRHEHEIFNFKDLALN